MGPHVGFVLRRLNRLLKRHEAGFAWQAPMQRQDRILKEDIEVPRRPKLALQPAQFLGEQAVRRRMHCWLEDGEGRAGAPNAHPKLVHALGILSDEDRLLVRAHLGQGATHHPAESLDDRHIGGQRGLLALARLRLPPGEKIVSSRRLGRPAKTKRQSFGQHHGQLEQAVGLTPLEFKLRLADRRAAALSPDLAEIERQFDFGVRHPKQPRPTGDGRGEDGLQQIAELDFREPGLHGRCIDSRQVRQIPGNLALELQKVLNPLQTLARFLQKGGSRAGRDLQGLDTAVADPPHPQRHAAIAQQEVEGVEVGAVELLTLAPSDREGSQQRQASQLVELRRFQQQLEFDLVAHALPEAAIRRRPLRRPSQKCNNPEGRASANGAHATPGTDSLPTAENRGKRLLFAQKRHQRVPG